MPQKAFLCIMALAFITCAAVFGQSVEKMRIALADFEVVSSNQDFANLGKGFVEFISVDLSKSRQITLIDREKRNQLLEEQAFSLSEVADETQAVKIGQLLAANYLLSGSIFDIAGNLSITFQILNVETGEIVFKDKVNGKLESYDSLCAAISRNVLENLKADVPQTLLAKTTENIPKPKEAAVAFSDAVAAIDRSDTKTAKQKLEVAKKQDPGNEAVTKYLDKLAGASPRFRIELETCALPYNPAYNGLIEEDSFYSTFAFSPSATPKNPAVAVGDTGYEAFEAYSENLHLGYRAPLGGAFGFSVDAALLPVNSHLTLPGTETFTYGSITDNKIIDNVSSFGLGIGLGWQPVKGFALGVAGVGAMGNFNKVVGANQQLNDPIMSYGVIAGLVGMPFGDVLTLDCQAVYSSLVLPTLDIATHTMTDTPLPIIFDSTATVALLDRTLFIAVKEIGEWYTQANGGWASKSIGICEFWPVKFLGLRGGYEFVYLNLSSKTALGHGAIGGVSLKFGSWDVDLNATYRANPLRVLPGYTLNHLAIMASVGFRPEWLKR